MVQNPTTIDSLIAIAQDMFENSEDLIILEKEIKIKEMLNKMQIYYSLL
jgi:hypothetical protein